MRPLFVLLLLAAGPVSAQASWSGSALAAWTTSSGYPIREPYLKNSYGLLASGYWQFTPAFGLGVELGYGRYGAGSFERGPQPACASPDCTVIGTVESRGSQVRTVLQLSLAARLRRTEGLLRPRVGISVGAYPLYGSEDSVDVYRDPAGAVVRMDPHRGSGNRGGGPGAGLTLGLDVLPSVNRHAVSAEVRLHGVLTGYSGGLYSASFFQAGLGYTFW